MTEPPRCDGSGDRIEPRLEAASAAVEAWMRDHDLTGYWYESLAADVLAAADRAERPALPRDDVTVDFGEQRPGVAHPMPPEVRAAYEARIEAAAKRPGVRHDR